MENDALVIHGSFELPNVRRHSPWVFPIIVCAPLTLLFTLFTLILLIRHAVKRFHVIKTKELFWTFFILAGCVFLSIASMGFVLHPSITLCQVLRLCSGPAFSTLYVPILGIVANLTFERYNIKVARFLPPLVALALVIAQGLICALWVYSSPGSLLDYGGQKYCDTDIFSHVGVISWNVCILLPSACLGSILIRRECAVIVPVILSWSLTPVWFIFSFMAVFAVDRNTEDMCFAWGMIVSACLPNFHVCISLYLKKCSSSDCDGKSRETNISRNNSNIEELPYDGCYYEDFEEEKLSGHADLDALSEARDDSFSCNVDEEAEEAQSTIEDEYNNSMEEQSTWNSTACQRLYPRLTDLMSDHGCLSHQNQEVQTDRSHIKEMKRRKVGRRENGRKVEDISGTKSTATTTTTEESPPLINEKKTHVDPQQDSQNMTSQHSASLPFNNSLNPEYPPTHEEPTAPSTGPPPYMHSVQNQEGFNMLFHPYTLQRPPSDFMWQYFQGQQRPSSFQTPSQGISPMVAPFLYQPREPPRRLLEQEEDVTNHNRHPMT